MPLPPPCAGGSAVVAAACVHRVMAAVAWGVREEEVDRFHECEGERDLCRLMDSACS